MEDFSGEVVYPTIEQICEVNRRMIEEFDGFFLPPDNLNNLNALEYILAAITFPVYGHTLYPALKEKAAAIAHQIISRHVFQDGNKRTAVHVAWGFLRSNRIRVFLEPTIVQLTEAIARGDAGYDELLQWLHGHQET